MKNLLITFFLIIIIQSSYAGTISGKVFLDNETDHSNILIKLIAQSNSAESNSTNSSSDGTYSLEVENGIYSVEYSKNGYQDYTLNETILVSSNLTIANVTLSSKAIKNISGDIDGIWYADTTYNIIGTSTIQSGFELVIEPGTVIQFNGNYKIQTYGTLISIGEKNNQIHFTSAKEVKNAGDWDGIYIYGSDTSRIAYSIIEYAGSNNNETAPVNIDQNGNLIIKNSTISYSEEGAIHNLHGYADIQENSINNITGGMGIFLQNLAFGQVNGNRIQNCRNAILTFSQEIDITSNIITDCNTAIVCGSDKTFSHNIISNNDIGFYVFFTGKTPHLTNNTILANTVGIELEDTNSKPYISNSIIYNNGTAIKTDEGSIPNSIEYNLFYSNTSLFNGSYPHLGTIVTTNQNDTDTDTYYNIFQSPGLYSEEIEDDFFTYLLPTSLAIDAGIPSKLDSDGSIVDMGARVYDNLKPEYFDLHESSLDHFSYDSMTLNLNWHKSLDPDHIATSIFYKVILLNNLNEVVLDKTGVSDTFFVINNSNVFNQNSIYKWVIESSDDLEITVSNDTLDISIPNLAPSDIQLLSPANDLLLPDLSQVLFQWEENLDTDPIQYSLWLKSDVIDTLFNEITDSSFELNDLLAPNTSYQWALIASDGQESTFSDTLSFFTPNIAPANFDLIAPVGGIKLTSFGSIEFVWTTSSDIDSVFYDLYIYNDSFDTLLTVGKDTSYMVDLKFLDPNLAYTWHVSASDKIDTTYSKEEIFISSNIAPANFNLMSPIDGIKLASFDSIEFVWTASSDIDSVFYDLYIYNDSFDTLLTVGKDTSYMVDLKFLNPNFAYTWHVTASDKIDTTYSKEEIFISSNIAPGSFILVSPVDQTVDQLDAIVFTWTESKDVEEIKYNVFLEGPSRDSVIYLISDTTVTFSDSLFFDSSGTYQWYVMAFDQYDTTYSETQSFISPMILASNNLESKIMVYPNPSTEQLTIELPEKEAINLELVDMKGQVVLNHKVRNHESDISLDVRDINAGIYILRIYGTIKILYATKIIISK